MARKSRWSTQAVEPPAPALMDAWIYGRISSGQEKNADSVDSQITLATEYIAAKPGLVLGGVFRDDGISGTVFDRPGYNRMLEGIRSGAVRCVVVKDLSRLGRDYIVVGELLFKTFTQYNVRFISINDYYDSADEDARRKRLIVLFKNLINQMYSRNTGKQVRSAYATKQMRGEPIGNKPPFGYLYEGKGAARRLVIEPEGAEVVRRMFTMRAEGRSIHEITAHMNRNKVPSPRNHYYNLGLMKNEKYAVWRPWDGTTIRREILQNEVYIGNLALGKTEVRDGKNCRKPRQEWIIHPDNHEAIVEKELFDTVQRLMGESSERFKKTGNHFAENIFAGRVFCSRCGRAATRSIQRRKTIADKFDYYCPTCHDELRHTLGKDKIPRFPLYVLERAIYTELRTRIDACLDMDALLDEVSRSAAFTGERNALLSKRRQLEQALSQADELLANAYVHHLSGLLDSREFELARAKFESDREAAEAALERNRDELERSGMDAAQTTEWLAACRKFAGFDRLDRDIVAALVERIEITPMSRELHVKLAFQDGFAELERLMREGAIAHAG